MPELYPSPPCQNVTRRLLRVLFTRRDACRSCRCLQLAGGPCQPSAGGPQPAGSCPTSYNQRHLPASTSNSRQTPEAEHDHRANERRRPRQDAEGRRPFPFPRPAGNPGRQDDQLQSTDSQRHRPSPCPAPGQPGHYPGRGRALPIPGSHRRHDRSALPRPAGGLRS